VTAGGPNASAGAWFCTLERAPARPSASTSVSAAVHARLARRGARGGRTGEDKGRRAALPLAWAGLVPDLQLAPRAEEPPCEQLKVIYQRPPPAEGVAQKEERVRRTLKLEPALAVDQHAVALLARRADLGPSHGVRLALLALGVGLDEVLADLGRVELVHALRGARVGQDEGAVGGAAGEGGERGVEDEEELAAEAVVHVEVLRGGCAGHRGGGTRGEGESVMRMEEVEDEGERGGAGDVPLR